VTIGSLNAGAAPVDITYTYTVLPDDITYNGGGDGLIENLATVDTDQTGPASDDADVPITAVLTAVVDDEYVHNADNTDIIGIPGDETNGDLTTPITQLDESVYALNLLGLGRLDFTAEAVTVGRETVSIAWDDIESRYVATISESPDDARIGNSLFYIYLNGDSPDSFVLASNVLHEADGSLYSEGADSLVVSLAYSDESGIDRSVNLVINDDVSLLDSTGYLSNQALDGASGVISIDGTWSYTQGADALSNVLDFIPATGETNVVDGYVYDFNLLDLRVDGATVSYDVDDVVYVAGTDASPAYYLLSGTYTHPDPDITQPLGFTAKLFDDKTYVFELDAVATTSLDFDNSEVSTLKGEGPSGGKVYSLLDIASGEAIDVNVTAALKSGSTYSAVDVNVSTQGVSVGSGNLDYNEKLTINPYTAFQVTGFTIGIGDNGFQKSDVMGFRLVLQTGGSIEGTVKTTGSGPNEAHTVNVTTQGYVFDQSYVSNNLLHLNAQSFGLTEEQARQFDVDYIELTGDSVNTTLKILFGFQTLSETQLPPLPVSADFQILASDSDGDQIDTQFTVSWDPTAESSGVLLDLVPIALDLNHDSRIDYLSLHESSVMFDYASDIGQAHSAWVAPSDGLLVFDRDGNGVIEGLSEISFASDHPNANTDLEGLSLAFDTDHNGVFDANDEQFHSFGVWQDLNSDGIQQELEYNSLSHWGIESISLDYLDGSAPHSEAGGDVDVYGQISVAYEDGAIGLAEDVAFAVQVSDLVDQVLSDPALLDSAPTSTDPLPDTTVPLSDIGTAVETFLATEPVTDTHLATYTQDVNLSTDTTTHETTTTTDTTVHDTSTTTTDTTVYDPTHDATVYDPTHDTTVHDVTTYDHVI
jgi:hypothetical protein